ncbi:Cobalt/magnesium transport protein CorA [uncultured archaeon]|nr:Cobalt/magnesium transport protein CorA [uncultured archaeon]
MRSQSTGKELPLRYRLRGTVYQIFTDNLMIVLALLLIPVIFLPFLFKFSHFMLVLFRAVSYVIIVIFALEYFLKLYVADSRRAYATNPWHVLDLLIVAISLVIFLPRIPFADIGRTSPMLRLLRVTRIFAVAGRTVKRAVPVKPIERAMPSVSRMKINMLTDGKIKKGALKEDIFSLLATSGYNWIDLQDVSEVDIGFISDVLKIPGVLLTSKIIKESYPKIDFFSDFTSIFIRDMKLRSEGTGIRDIDISRNNMLIILADNYIATISADKSEIFDQVISDGPVMEKEEFIVSILYSIFRRKITDYDEIVRLFEQRVIAMEELPAGLARPSFLGDTFYFKKDIQIIHSNLWHFTQVLKAVRSSKIPAGGLKESYLPLFGILYDESTYLFETSENVRDNLISLIDLHINTVSVGLNKVMRILAVITSLGLIPSIISGLFGVNLIDSPYPVRISEVFFLELSIMLLAAYAFYRRGWLR